MKIAFYFNDKGFDKLDLSNPMDGNNGVGGTQFCFLMLASVLTNYKEITPVFYHYNEKNILPKGVISKIINTDNDIIKECNEDILIFKTEGCSDFEKQLCKTDLKCIAWAHNYIFNEEANLLSKSKSIKKIVFVGREQYERYIDHDIIKKSTYIYNMVNTKKTKYREIPKENSVTYTGSLVPSKGFHILAKCWGKVLKQVPDAQLYVIGGGNLYNRNAKLGKYNITDDRYEKKFIKYLLSDNKILKSVHFLGTLGNEKEDIYLKTKVGVMNPSGKTETFGLSAVEMEGYGIPVVTSRKNGLLDTSINKKTGYLVSTQKDMVNKICQLLKDDDLNIKLGTYAKNYVLKFSPDIIINDWIKLLYEIYNNIEQSDEYKDINIFNGLKFIRIINSKIKNIGIPTLSLVTMESMIKNIIRRR